MISMCCFVWLLDNRICFNFQKRLIRYQEFRIISQGFFVFNYHFRLLSLCQLYRSHKVFLLLVMLLFTFSLKNSVLIGVLLPEEFSFILFLILFFSFIWTLLLISFLWERFVDLMILTYFLKTTYYLILVIK